MLIQSFIIKKTHFCTPALPHVSPHSSWSLLSQKSNSFGTAGLGIGFEESKRKKPPIRMTTFYSNSSLKYPLTDSRFRKLNQISKTTGPLGPSISFLFFARFLRRWVLQLIASNQIKSCVAATVPKISRHPQLKKKKKI